jgi:thiol:disulfide interchange protein/DsbC/DsbD-like thiol-disulfide interchange protein
MMRAMSMGIRVLLAVAALGASSAALAQVKAELLAADSSVRSGEQTTVVLRLSHEPQWHTYWRNPGTGLATSIQWALPAGWQAGDIQWPVPHLIRNAAGEVTGHGYTGVIDLPMSLVAARDSAAGVLNLKAHVEWLMCAQECVPGRADLSLRLPVSSAAPAPNPAVRAELARMPMPQSMPAGSTASAVRRGDLIALHLAGGEILRDAHFFPQDDLVQFDAPQSVKIEAGSLTLMLPVSTEADGSIDKITGVFAGTDSRGDYRGIDLVLPVAVPAERTASTRLSSGAEDRASHDPSMLALLSLAFVGGLILNLMPCVFPVLAIKILGFVGQAGDARGRRALHGVVHTLGVLLSFWALALALAVLRTGGSDLGWGFQLQSAPFVFSIAVVLLLVALNLSGVFEVGLRASGIGSSWMTSGGYKGSFLSGVLATVVATPCSAPFLAPALGAALTLPPEKSFVVFSAIALGLSSPYLLLTIVPQAAGLLPRPGRWMLTLKSALAFPIYGTVACLVWVLAGQTSESGLLSVLLGLTVVAFGAWTYGLYQVPAVSALRRRVMLLGALALLTAGLQLGWPRAEAAKGIVWEPWSSERVAQLRNEGRSIFVDFTARWCATCQANKKIVFSSAKVQEIFRERQIVTLRADWTNADPRITAELAKWQRSAVPFNLVYVRGLEPRALPEILTPSLVLGAFGDEAGR